MALMKFGEGCEHYMGIYKRGRAGTMIWTMMYWKHRLYDCLGYLRSLEDIKKTIIIQLLGLEHKYHGFRRDQLCKKEIIK